MLVSYLSIFITLSIFLIAYSFFLIKRPGVHTLTVGFLQGLGISLIYPLILLIYSRKDYNGVLADEVLSVRGTFWIFLCLFLIVLGKEVTVFLFESRCKSTVLELLRTVKGYVFSINMRFLCILFIVYLFIYCAANNFQVHKVVFYNGWFHPVFVCCIINFAFFLLCNSLFCEKKDKLLIVLLVLTMFFCFSLFPQFKTFLLTWTFFIGSISLLFLLNNFDIKRFILFFLVAVCAITLCSYQRQKKCGFSGFRRLTLQPAATMLCLKENDKPKQGFFWVKRMFSRLLPHSEHKNKLSFGSFCAFAFYAKQGRTLEGESKERYFHELKQREKYPWSFAVNFIGEVDLFFGYKGVFLFFLLGLCLGMLDAWFLYHKQFLFICLAISLNLCFGSLTSSSFLSSCIKSGILPILLFIFLESFLKNRCES